ncbi:hypothetical protein GEMRC1_001116 [Eukaryota sp. GEM-RC1]
MLFVPLKDVGELEADLMQFLFTRVKDRCVDSMSKENSNLVSDIEKLMNEIEELKKLAADNQSVHQSKMIRFSQTRKHSQLQVSEDRKRVVIGSGGFGTRCILGENPLLPGNVYTWKLRYQGDSSMLFVGVIDERKFRVDVSCVENAHGIYNGNGQVFGCLIGTTAQWNPGELLEISADLINHTLTIKFVSNSSITFIETLPRLSSGNYYPYFYLYRSDHELEIVE